MVGCTSNNLFSSILSHEQFFLNIDFSECSFFSLQALLHVILYLLPLGITEDNSEGSLIFVPMWSNLPCHTLKAEHETWT